MTALSPLSWRTVALLAGISYGFVGIVFGLPSSNVRFWRLAAWVVSAIIYGSHILYERYRLGNRPLTTALHCAVAVALGGFLLAVAAIVHAAMVPVHAPYWRFAIALVAWPTITAVPAFLVALVLSFLVGRHPNSLHQTL